MGEINHFTQEVVEKARSHMQTAVNRVFPDLEVPCPACGAPRLKQTDATYECREMEACDFRISKHIAGRTLSDRGGQGTHQHEKALPERDGFVSRFNKPFSAALRLVQNETKTGKKGKWKTEFVFDEGEPDSAEDLTEDQVIKTIP